jgi:hypothetical protein
MAVLAPTIERPSTFTVVDPLTMLYEKLEPITAVEALYANWHSDGLEVWLVVHQLSPAARKEIFAQELALMQAFPGLGIDTHLIDRAAGDSLATIDLASGDAFLRFSRPSYA